MMVDITIASNKKNVITIIANKTVVKTNICILTTRIKIIARLLKVTRNIMNAMHSDKLSRSLMKEESILKLLLLSLHCLLYEQ